jgi:isopentenyl diphosphate isomerase/L-lactate dehydrogenase-like FMN-dependent dehydrogenase
MVKFAPQVLTRPRWLASWARTGRIPELTVPNMGVLGEPARTFFSVYGEWMQTPLPTWEDLRWLREQWDGPLMLKGVMRVDDARLAVDAGFDALSVSNHGGNNLDGHRPRSGHCRRSPTRSVRRSKCFWTAASAAARTWSRRWRWVPAR